MKESLSDCVSMLLSAFRFSFHLPCILPIATVTRLNAPWDLHLMANSSFRIYVQDTVNSNIARDRKAEMGKGSLSDLRRRWKIGS